MGSDTKRAYGATGRDDLLFFDPEDLIIVTDKDHPLYDERVDLPVDERLVTSIMMMGVIEPVVIRKNGEDDKGRPQVEVVDGRQRVRAARVANHRLRDQGAELVRVPGVRRRGDTGSLMGVMFAANEIRRNDTPIVRAKKMQRYLDNGRTIEEAAATFGVSTATVKNHLVLIDLHPTVQAAIEKGRIGVTHGKSLAAFPQEEQEKALEELLKKPENGEGLVPLTERVEQVVGGRGKLRKRVMKSRKELKHARTSLEASRSADAELATAMIDWFLGDAAALNKFRAIKARLENLAEETEE